MPKKIQNSLQDYLSKIKKQTPQLQFSHSSLSSTTSKIIAGCTHPKSLSFNLDRKARKNHHDDHQPHQNDEAAATLEDIDKFLIENFKSLYGEDDHGNNSHKDDDYLFTHNNKKKEEGKNNHRRKGNNITTLGGVGILFDSPRYFTPPPDLCGSHRFFVSPVSSGSLIEEAGLSGLGTPSDQDTGSTSASTVDTQAHHHHAYDVKDDTSAIPKGIKDCIALLRISPSPYEDFRRSMQEMLDAKVYSNQRVDWDFMEELLFCYLRLNEKKQYRYILSAFVDVVVVLRQNSSNRGPEGSQS